MTPGDILSEAHGFLLRRVSQAAPQSSIERFLRRAEAVALLGASFPPGVLAYPELENRFLANRDEISRVNRVPPLSVSGGLRRVSTLHVATRLARVGGHTRVLAGWIEQDLASTHAVVLTNQLPEVVPAWFRDAVEARGGVVVDLPASASLCQRAALTRELAERLQPDRIVLHQHPWDIVPAFAFLGAGAPVALMNHADHVPWVGVCSSDVVLDYREAAARESIERRQARGGALLPLPLRDLPPRVDKGAAKADLGLSPDSPVLLTLATTYKLRPTREHDFFAAVERLLGAHPRAHMFVVGATEADRERLYGRGTWRVHCLGVVESPAPYLRAADVFLEPFPLGAGLGTLDAAAYGLAQVSGLRPLTPLFACEHPTFAAVADPALSEDEWLAQVGELLEDGKRCASVGDAARSAMERHHTGDGWRSHLAPIQVSLEVRGHQPAPLVERGEEARGPDLPPAMPWNALATYGISGLRDFAAQKAELLSPVEMVTLLRAARRLGEFRGYAGPLRALGAAALRRLGGFPRHGVGS